MQVFEKAATFLILIGVAVPYLLIMNGFIATAEILFGADKQIEPATAWS